MTSLLGRKVYIWTGAIRSLLHACTAPTVLVFTLGERRAGGAQACFYVSINKNTDSVGLGSKICNFSETWRLHLPFYGRLPPGRFCRKSLVLKPELGGLALEQALHFPNTKRSPFSCVERMVGGGTVTLLPTQGHIGRPKSLTTLLHIHRIVARHRLVWPCRQAQIKGRHSGTRSMVLPRVHFRCFLKIGESHWRDKGPSLHLFGVRETKT